MRFQLEKSIEPVDGVVGDATWSVLRSEPERAAVGDSGTGRATSRRASSCGSPGRRTSARPTTSTSVMLTAYSVGTVDPQLDAVHVVAHVRDPDGDSRAVETTLKYFDSHRELQVIVGGVSGGKKGRFSILAQLSVDGESGAEDSVHAEFDVD